jgi:hypothetical protein
MNERARILNMISEGVITAEEAEKLLDAIGEKDEADTEPIELKDKRGRKPKKLRVKIDSKENKNKAKVNISIPLSVVRTFGPIIVKNLPNEAKEEMSKSGIDFAQIVDDIESLVTEADGEDIVNIDTEGEDAAKVRIYLE